MAILAGGRQISSCHKLAQFLKVNRALSGLTNVALLIWLIIWGVLEW
jgi:hypothetical protein